MANTMPANGSRTKTITVVFTATFGDGQNVYPDGSSLLDTVTDITPDSSVYVEFDITGDCVSGDLVSVAVSD